MRQIEPYRASKALEDFIISQAGPHFICQDGSCIPDLDSLRRWKERHGDNRFYVPIPVYPRTEDSPFSEQADGAYQAWHDRLHAEYEYEFNICGEFKLASLHMGLCKHAGLPDEDCCMLFHFVATRVMYHYHHNGVDPPDRARFITVCFRDGGRSAARGDYLMQYSDYA